MSKQIKPVCESYQASRKTADSHTRDVFAMEAAILIDDLMSGKGIHNMLPGWPVCGSGDFAFKIRKQGNHTQDINSVTCIRCLNKMKTAGITKHKEFLTIPSFLRTGKD